MWLNIIKKEKYLFGLNKHSLHISDHNKDTFRISSSLLNDNSIDLITFIGVLEHINNKKKGSNN